jgi:hypothetical protein
MLINDTHAKKSNSSYFEIIRFQKLHNTDESYVIIAFHHDAFDIHCEVEIPLTDVTSASKLRKYIPVGFIIPDIPLDKLHVVLFNEIGEAMCTMIPFTALPQGYNLVEGRWLYVVGDYILGDTKKVSEQYFPHNPHNLVFNRYPTSTIEAIFEWCHTYVKQGPDKAALLLTALTPYIRPVVESLKLRTTTVHGYVVGKSGVGKTEFAKLLTSLFQRDAQRVNLSSDMKTIKRALSMVSDTPVLIDDLNSSSSPSEYESKKSKASELIHMTSCAGQISSEGNESIDLCNKALIVTAERILSNHSTNNRCIIIACEQPFQPSSLTWLQRNQVAYRMFVASFITWICDEASSLSAMVRRHALDGAYNYRSAQRDSGEYSGYHRIMSSCTLLKITADLLNLFFSVSQIDDEEQEKFSRMLNKGIEAAVSDTLACVHSTSSVSDVVATIANIFSCNPHELIASSADAYFENLQDKYYLFFPFKNQYFFRGAELADFLRKSLKRDISVTEISKALSEEHLLDKYGGEFCADLPAGIFHGKKKNKKRDEAGKFYRLSVDALKDLVLRLYPDYLARKNSPLEW